MKEAPCRLRLRDLTPSHSAAHRPEFRHHLHPLRCLNPHSAASPCAMRHLSSLSTNYSCPPRTARAVSPTATLPSATSAATAWMSSWASHTTWCATPTCLPKPSRTCGPPSAMAAPGPGWSRTCARTGATTGCEPMSPPSWKAASRAAICRCASSLQTAKCALPLRCTPDSARARRAGR